MDYNILTEETNISIGYVKVKHNYFYKDKSFITAYLYIIVDIIVFYCINCFSLNISYKFL